MSDQMEEVRRRIKEAEEEDIARRDRYQRRRECLALAVELWKSAEQDPGREGFLGTARRVTNTAEHFERWLKPEEGR